ncbi:hypothetical protein A9236_02180 [Polynucleobacter sp. QLW-P1DATA-2]|nr:hypothetical protein A9236_02180 [Polynucleobacter sp. QLW-P1DATA-2]
MQTNLEAMPDAMKIRRCTIEHTFGTLKSWMGAHSLPHQNQRACEYRNESAYPGLQPQTGHEDHGQ